MLHRALLVVVIAWFALDVRADVARAPAETAARADARAHVPAEPATAPPDLPPDLPPEPPPDFGRDGKLGIDDLPPPSMGMGELLGPMVKTFVMLGVVLALVYLSLHKGLGKLVQRQNAGKRVKLVERTALDTKRSVFLVEIDGKHIVLAAGEGGITKLAELDAPPPETAKPTVAARFVDALTAKKPDAPVVSVPKQTTEEVPS